MADTDLTAAPETPAAAQPAKQAEPDYKAERERLTKERDAYKAREEQRENANLTETERLKVERDQMKAQLEKTRLGSLKEQIAREQGLPPGFGARLQGSDEHAIRADAEAIKREIPVKRNDGREAPAPTQRVYKRSELAADPKLAASPEVRKAAAEGRIVNG